MRAKRKRKLGPKQREYVQRVTRSILETMLEFKMRYDVTNYLIEKTRLDWRSIESDLYTKSPIKAKGLVFRNWEDEPRSGVEFANEFLPPEKIVEYLGEFPMDAAAANYVFTLLEIYGDLIVQKTNKKFFDNKNRFTNWHHKVFGDAETQDRSILVKMANGFSEPFLVAGKEIDSGVVLKLIELKRARNEFAHDADEDHRFEVLFEYAVAVVYEIYFLLCPEESMLIVDPFEGTSDELDEARYDQRILQEIAEEEGEDLVRPCGDLALRSSPCNPPQPSPYMAQRRRRCFIAPALGRPRNDKAAPDVRAPVVRGRWHFWGRFGPFYPSWAGLLPAAAWHR